MFLTENHERHGNRNLKKSGVSVSHNTPVLYTRVRQNSSLGFTQSPLLYTHVRWRALGFGLTVSSDVHACTLKMSGVWFHAISSAVHTRTSKNSEFGFRQSSVL